MGSTPDDAGRAWNAPALPPAPPVRKKVNLNLALQLCHRSGRVRARAQEEIERRVLGQFKPERLKDRPKVKGASSESSPAHWSAVRNYLLCVGYATDEELDRIVRHDIVQAAETIAREHNCVLDSYIHMADDPRRAW